MLLFLNESRKGSTAKLRYGRGAGVLGAGPGALVGALVTGD
jgi:hypothetical protein